MINQIYSIILLILWLEVINCKNYHDQFDQGRLIKNETKIARLFSIDKIRSSTNNVTSSGINRKNLYPSIVTENVSVDQMSDHLLEEFNKFGAYSKLTLQLLQSIVNKELGATIMQQLLNKANDNQKNQQIEDLAARIDNISDKMSQQVQDIHSAIEMSGELLQEMYGQHSNTTASDSFDCCNPYGDKWPKYYESNKSGDLDAKDFQEIKIKEQQIKNDYYGYDKRFFSWISKSFSCDIGQWDRNKQFYPDLTEQFGQNLATNVHIKWQYYISFKGLHIEYPAYYPPNNYCFLNRLNKKIKFSTNESNITSKRYFNGNNKKVLPQHWLSLHHHKAFDEQKQLLAQRHQNNLMAAALPRPKMIIIVLDRGSALTDHQLRLAKSIAKHILNSLSRRDKISLIDLWASAHDASDDACGSNLAMANADYESKLIYSKYIDRLQRSYNSTNHYIGLQKAFEIIEANYLSFKEHIEMEPHVLIAYISRGLLASLADARPVMQLIADKLANSSFQFIINTYALIDERIPIMLETIFLREIAAMNFRKFNVQIPEQKSIRPGIMVAINSTDQLSSVLETIYTVFKNDQQSDQTNSLYISLPHQDLISKDTYISLSKAYHHPKDGLIGVIGIDISLLDWAADIIHYDGHQNSYAFLMDGLTGKLIYHPVFSKYFQETCKPKQVMGKYGLYMNQASDSLENSFINAHLVEPELDDAVLKQMIFTSHSGQFQINTTENKFKKTLDGWSYENRRCLLTPYKSIVYHWRRIPATHYIIVLVSSTESKNEPIRTKFHGQAEWQLVSHRLDYHWQLQGHLKLCRHFNQLATMDKATVHLSPNAFIDRYQSEIDSDSSDKIKRQWSYLADRSDIIANPGFQPNVRPDLILVNELVDQWKRKNHELTECSKYVVRKYIALASASFIVYPGLLMDQSYRPKNRPWYIRAIAEPEKIHLLPPYMDEGGSGYIVTISQAIYKNSNQTGEIWGVMGIDLTLGYFYRILDAMASICRREKSSCFMADQFGYIIVHSSLSRPPTMPMIERQHLTHKEPHMMNGLLSRENHFVRKLVCNSYTDRTMQRFYRFNMSLNGIVTSVYRNEQISCAKYMIISLATTNTLFGMVDHSCDNVTTTFCPCSLTDRLCLNCHRLEQTDCECPCECPLVMNVCNGQLIESDDGRHPICTTTDISPSYEQQLREPYGSSPHLDSYNSCIRHDCHNKLSESECKGILGCEWCTMDNGMTKLSNPFCSNQMVCFGGIFGSENPYLNQQPPYHYYYRYNEKPIQQTPSTAPIGPLTATLIICFIILTFSVYCFHFQSSRNLANTRYINTSNHNDHQMLQPDNHNDIIDNSHEHDSNIEPLAQAVVNTNYVRIVSPYQYNSNYRRRTEAESDYGYSTMTPNEDSEHNIPIYINPDIIRTRKKTNMDSRSSVASIVSNEGNSSIRSSTSSSSFHNNEDMGRLPPPPSTRSKSKNRNKQIFVDNSHSKTTRLATVQERSNVDVENSNLAVNAN
ncbi:VWFA and cache domain-containing protein 1 [Dermatophagoides pteronyssinus]|uniref:VWFA and cache domain-containing protein 1 n=1 Tax=Dermatophagoides pteronyssinus TaxID=6956 RepID=UPI003F6802F8